MSAAMRLERHTGRMVRCFSDRPKTIGALLDFAVERASGTVALIAGDRRLTYRELDHHVDRLAAFLSAHGLVAGERIGLLIGNRPEFVSLVLAAVRLGAIFVPMNIRQRRSETAYMLQQCTAALLIHDADCADELPASGDVPSLRKTICVSELPPPRDAVGVGDGFVSLSPMVEVAEDDIACILYTSGTTGRPKGAMLTHLGCVHSVMHYRQAFSLDEGVVGAMAVPASHVTGLVAIMLTIIHAAGTNVIMEAFRAAAFIELAARERVAYTLMVPAMYKLCLMDETLSQADLTAWRVGGFGGAPMPPAVIDELSQALPRLELFNIYGATETTSPVTITRPGSPIGRGDVGRALPCADLVVVDGEGREVLAGERGELLISGPMVIPGYWDDPVATGQAFVGGFWRSGDIASIDADGSVFIQDRMKDVINRGGYKIYCLEVENLLMRYPGMVECAVFGRPDEVMGENVHAIVHGIDDSHADALHRWCASQLSDYKVPRYFAFSPAPLPRNANGKIIKQQLRDA